MDGQFSRCFGQDILDQHKVYLLMVELVLWMLVIGEMVVCVFSVHYDGQFVTSFGNGHIPDSYME